MRLFRWFLVWLSCIYSVLCASDGIIVAVCDRYMNDFLPALAWLRLHVKSELPIEVWYAGNELSEEAKEKLCRFAPISFRDIAQHRGDDPKYYRGYQIKPFILEATTFDRVVLIDADIFLFIDPRELLNMPAFQETGAFFFRDTDNRKFGSYNTTNRKFYHYNIYENRRAILHQLIDQPSSYMPKDWQYYWGEAPPTDENPQIAEFMESGVVVIDKKRHKRGIAEVVKINQGWRQLYRHFLGDKDTFWMGMEVAREPYTVNDKIPYYFYGGKKLYRHTSKRIDLVHHIDGRLIFQQKSPIEIGLFPYYCYPWSKSQRISVPPDELHTFGLLKFFYEQFRG